VPPRSGTGGEEDGVGVLARVARRVQGWERRTRPVDDEVREVHARRWAELPERSRTPGQLIGRHAVGCEGTHGVFPRCNMSCAPCYHSRDANRVQVDGDHTVAEVDAQMGLLRRLRGPRGHAQLIGGEVSLLDPDDHARALAAMRAWGREPMSFTHGDFDYDHLERLAVGPDGRPRFRRLSFAAHIDTTMTGRRGAHRSEREADLDPFRKRFCAMFRRLRREHGVRSFLAHNMTVTAGNVDQIPDVVAGCRRAGFRLLSFQPAAHVGDERHWRDGMGDLDPDLVWSRIEEGAGVRLPHRVLQLGDDRCNRAAWGFFVGDRWHAYLDEDDPRDLAARDAFFARLGGVHFKAPPGLLAARLLRVAARHPAMVAVAAAWAVRTVRRVGIGPLVRHGVEPMVFGMHRFMAAEDVGPAWDLLERGETSTDPRIAETQERLRSCVYAMAHPETGRLVPACVQHAVLDPGENRVLVELLPLRGGRPTAPMAR